MKNTIIFTFIFFINVHYILANEYWKKDYSKIDSFAITVKRTTNINKLALKLTKRYSTDVEKYRSIFSWIAHNISYDYEALKEPTLIEIDPIKVIDNKKAVCAGYSNLFKKLCELANLECVTISGWSRHKQDIGEALSKDSNHAWNAIKIKNEWYLCDVTWGAGSVYNEVFSFEFNDQYFCTPPYLFSYNHLPEDRQWLLGTKISEQEFINNPLFYSEAIKLNTINFTPNNGILEYKKGDTIRFEFSVEADVQRISIRPSNIDQSTRVKFRLQDGVIKFDYTWDSYSPYLYIYFNNKGLVVYKIRE